MVSSCLSLGHVGRIVVQSGVVTLGKGAHEVVHVSRFRSRLDLLLRGSLSAVGDVLADGPAEQPGVLQHHAEQSPQVVPRHLPGVHAVDQDRALVDLVEAHEQVDQRGLAGPGRADDGHRLPGLHLHVQVFDQRHIRKVAEGHVLELHVAFACFSTTGLAGSADCSVSSSSSNTRSDEATAD